MRFGLAFDKKGGVKNGNIAEIHELCTKYFQPLQYRLQ